MSNTSRAETKLKKDTKKKTKESDIGKLSPTHSEIEEPITFKPIDGDDIQALAIKEDDLKRIAAKQPRPPSEKRHSKDLLVRKKNPYAYPTLEVKVARLVPDKPLKPVEYSEHLGIHFDANGRCLAHSILGSVDEYLQEAAVRGETVTMPAVAVEVDDVPKADFYLKETHAVLPDNGENALNNWRAKMLERKNIQQNISKSIKRPLDDLVMNQADSARRFNEIKTLLDRTLPLVEGGKGKRLASEFWNQPFPIGHPDNGLFTTLTESEKGNLPEFEQIMKPLSTLMETDFKENQPAVVHYPWDSSEYLQKRLADLGPLIKAVVPHRPDFRELQVVGRVCERAGKERNQEGPGIGFEVNDTWCNPLVFDQGKEANSESNNHYLVDTGEDPFKDVADIVSEPVFGPCVSFGGQAARWTGNDASNLGVVALESRLNFETKAGKRVLATFEVYNMGTTAVYYDWKKSEEFNPFEVVGPSTQRFYFDSRSSVILPGELLKLHIVFKSLKGGIFTEKWQFITRPSVLNSASLILTLRGVAVQEDKHKKVRAAIERQLLNREAELIAGQMLDLIMSGVRTPERCPSPQNAYQTEEDLFNELNPDFYYEHETVAELKSLYDELRESIFERRLGDWDLSIDTLKQEIMLLDELDPAKQEHLARLNSLLNSLCFRKYSPSYSKMYSVAYNLLCQAVDSVSGELAMLKGHFSLASEVGEDCPGGVDEFNVRYERWRRENEAIKAAEQERRNRLEAAKGSKEGKEKGGKATAGGKKDDKAAKKDDKNKKSTPIPSAKDKSKQPVAREANSRSVSRNKDAIDERSRTPRNANVSVLTDEENALARTLFADKAYMNVYQELGKMVGVLARIFDEIILDVDVEERLLNLVFQSSVPSVPLNSDYID